jgi:CoA:oxalate CoA-transferase
VLAKYGLDWTALASRNPRLVMCSISGFGQNGVDAHRPANDLIALAMAGILHQIGYPDRPPAIPAVNIGDLTAGAHALAAVCGALFQRERTGAGQHIDVSMVECLAGWNDVGYLLFQGSEGRIAPARMGSDFFATSPMGIFAARDGYVAITLQYDQWESFTQIIGRPELGHDPRYETLSGRLANRAEVNQIVEDWLQSFERRDEPLAILERGHIQGAPVYDVPQAMTSPAVKGRGALQEFTYPGLGPVAVTRPPFCFSAAKVESPRPAPALGEHNAEVFGALLGYSEEKIAALIKDGVLVQQAADHEP